MLTAKQSLKYLTLFFSLSTSRTCTGWNLPLCGRKCRGHGCWCRLLISLYVGISRMWYIVLNFWVYFDFPTSISLCNLAFLYLNKKILTSTFHKGYISELVIEENLSNIRYFYNTTCPRKVVRKWLISGLLCSLNEVNTLDTSHNSQVTDACSCFICWSKNELKMNIK